MYRVARIATQFLAPDKTWRERLEKSGLPEETRAQLAYDIEETCPVRRAIRDANPLTYSRLADHIVAEQGREGAATLALNLLNIQNYSQGHRLFTPQINTRTGQFLPYLFEAALE